MELFKTSEEERFHKNVTTIVEFIKILIEEFKEKGYNVQGEKYLELCSYFLEQVNKQVLIEKFCQYSHPYWSQIKDKNKVFFLSNTDKLFGNFLPVDATSAISKVFEMKDKEGNDLLSADYSEWLWKNFRILVVISIKYIARKRHTCPDFLSELDLDKRMLEFEVTL